MRRQVLSLLVVVLLVSGCAPATNGPLHAPPGTWFRYTDSEAAWLAGDPSGKYSVLIPQRREIWIAPDGSGRLKSTPGNPIFFGLHDRAEWADRPVDRPTDEVQPAGSLWYEDLSSLPTDPTELSKAILDKLAATSPGNANDDQGLLDAARDMLKETVAPAEIRRAVFDMLMSMPAIKHQDAKDRLGRPGVSFWLDSSGEVAMRLTLFLDREQGLLGEEQTLLSALDDIDAAPPVVIGYVTYVDARLVDTTAEVTK